MAITFFAEVVVPADSGSATNTATQNTITPPSNMKVGDFVFVAMQQRGTATMSVGVTGGQRWRNGFRHTGTNIAGNWFWTRYDGTWSANPRFDFSAGTCTSVVMLVFRPSDTSKYWAIDLEPSLQTFTAAATVTVTGGTTTRASSVSLAVWMTADDNTWGTLSGSGWSKTGLTAQYRNTSGNDQSMTIAYNIRTSTGSVANVSQNEATNGNDAGISYFLVFYERDTDYIGDPTNYASSFAGGDRMLLHRAKANSNGNGVLMRLKGYSTMGGGASATIYPVLYKLNGGNYEFLKLGTSFTITTTEQWWTGMIYYPIVVDTTYYVGYYSLDSFDFRYMFHADWAAGESFDHYVANGTLPSFANIATGSVSNNYQTHEAIEIQFTTDLGGAISDSIPDISSSIIAKAILSGSTEGNPDVYSDMDGTTSGPGTASLSGLSDAYSDCYAELRARAILSGISENNPDVSSNIMGKAQLSGISESVVDANGDLIAKGILGALCDTYSESNSSITGKAILNGLSDSIPEVNSSIVARALLQGISESDAESISNIVLKAFLSGLSDSNPDVSSSIRNVLKLAGISDAYSESQVNSVFKALLSGISDSVSDPISPFRLILYLHGHSESSPDVYTDLIGHIDGSMQGISESFSDCYAGLILRAPLAGISESLTDAFIGIANVAVVYAGELRKCVGGILVLASLPDIYNNKNIAGKKLYIYKDGEMQEIKTLDS